MILQIHYGVNMYYNSNLISINLKITVDKLNSWLTFNNTQPKAIIYLQEHLSYVTSVLQKQILPSELISQIFNELVNCYIRVLVYPDDSTNIIKAFNSYINSFVNY